MFVRPCRAPIVRGARVRAGTALQLAALRLFPLLSVLLPGCSGGFQLVLTEEPKTKAECQNLINGRFNCEHYIDAKALLAEGSYDRARDELRQSNLGDRDFGKALARQIDEAERRAKEAGATRQREADLESTADTIDAKQVKRIVIGAAAPSAKAVCPGEPADLGLAVELTDGRTLTTWKDSNHKRGFVDFSIFDVKSDAGTFKNGQFVPTAEVPKVLDGKLAVRVSLAANSAALVEGQLPVHFGCLTGLRLGGADGQDGQMGAPGAGYSGQGTSGRPESGGNGQPGQSGAAGGDAPSVIVYVGYVARADGTRLVVARATTSQTQSARWFAGPAGRGTPSMSYASPLMVAPAPVDGHAEDRSASSGERRLCLSRAA